MEEKETDEELIKRHRKEKKDLQGEVYIVYNKQVSKTGNWKLILLCVSGCSATVVFI